MHRPQFRLRSLFVAIAIAAVLSALGAPAMAKWLRERNKPAPTPYEHWHGPPGPDGKIPV